MDGRGGNLGMGSGEEEGGNLFGILSAVQECPLHAPSDIMIRSGWFVDISEQKPLSLQLVYLLTNDNWIRSADLDARRKS
eukprot:5884222-Pyramimonas_sp.AAC.1